MRRSPADSTNRSLAAFGKLQHMTNVFERAGESRMTSPAPSISSALGCINGHPGQAKRKFWFVGRT